jgi:hypothetical protein
MPTRSEASDQVGAVAIQMENSPNSIGVSPIQIGVIPISLGAFPFPSW